MHSAKLPFACLPVVFLFAVSPSSAGSPNADAAPNKAAFVLRGIDMQGGLHQLNHREDSKRVAVVFLSTECPICNQSIPELNRIARHALGNGCAVYGVIADPSISRAEARKYAEDFKLEFPVLFDASLDLATHFKPSHVPEAFLLEEDGRVVYRGRINDAYASIGQRRLEITSHDLRDAIDALAAGNPIATPTTAPVGCRFESPVSEETPAAVTYARDIAPLLNAHCVTCHRAGEVAPFTLTSYEDSAKRAEWIAEVVQKRIMPPWRAEPNFGHFVGERRLTDREIGLLAAWATAGAPQGDPADLPPLPTFDSGWSLGEPDMILKMPSPYTVAADGPDIFWNFVLPLRNDEDVVIKAVEFRPGNPRVVHHAIIMADASGIPRAKDAESPEIGYKSLGGGEELATAAWIDQWTPGITTRKLPDGVGFRIRKGADLLINMHYHPSGKEEQDQSQVGIYLAKPDEKVERFVTEDPFGVITANIDIPPGASQHHVWKEFTLPVDVSLLSLFPHMHYLGSEMKLLATLPDGEELPLVWIKRWDFNWQDQYLCQTPIPLPKGTRLRLDGWYDNSESSPYQFSHPPQRVIIGEDTTNEMCLAIMKVTTDHREDAMTLRNTQIVDLIREVVASPMPLEGKMRLVKQFRDRLATKRDDGQ